MAQTSDRVSSIASRWGRVSSEQIRAMCQTDECRLEEFASDVRSMAASLLRQDETKGLRGFVRKLLG